MNFKQMAVFGMVAVVSVGAVSAQGGRGGDNGPRGGGRGGNGRELIELVATETGLTAQEILVQVRDGATLADLVTANGGSIDTIIDAVEVNVQERLDTALADGRITQEEYDERLAGVEAQVTAALNGERPEDGFFGGRGEEGGLRDRFGGERNPFDGELRAQLDAAGITPEDLRTQLEVEGATLNQVLTDNGIDVAALTATVLADAQTRLSEQVTAGEIDQATADERLADLETRINERLNADWEPREPREGRPGGRQNGLRGNA